MLNKYLNGEDQDFYTEKIILNELCKRGVIPAGNYIIKVSW